MSEEACRSLLSLDHGVAGVEDGVGEHAGVGVVVSVVVADHDVRHVFGREAGRLHRPAQLLALTGRARVEHQHFVPAVHLQRSLQLRGGSLEIGD